MNSNNANSTRSDVDALIGAAIGLLSRQRIGIQLLKRLAEATGNNDRGVASWAGGVVLAVDQRQQVM
jgi:hypothetical protein